ncbi:MAG TPA: hypothetical protein VEX13_07035 [Chloroflexia bacterium]|nr:hypothetical protein [Chloroflexia bacterium]
MTTPSASDRLDAFKELPPLMPQFLRKRRAGLPAVHEITQRLGIDRPAFFTLLQLSIIAGSYGGQPITLAQVRAFNPYQTIDDFTGPLSLLNEHGLILEDAEGAFSLSPDAQAVVNEANAAGRQYVAGHRPLPPGELELAALLLLKASDAVVSDPLLSPRPASHLAGYLAVGPVDADAPAMVRIEQHIFELWGARDDAHTKAWRDAGMEGPPMPMLTLLWNGAAHTLSELVETLKWQQTPASIESSLTYLVEKDLVTRHGDDIQLTPQGVIVRDDIERETDRIYFASWPHTLSEARWLRDKLKELVDNIPSKR